MLGPQFFMELSNFPVSLGVITVYCTKHTLTCTSTLMKCSYYLSHISFLHTRLQRTHTQCYTEWKLVKNAKQLQETGTGKTTLINNIRSYLSIVGKNVAMTATTGIASCLLIVGQTIHSWADIGKRAFFCTA